MNMPEIIEYNNQRLLTTEQLAEFYGTTPTRITQNFGYNKDKFIEGKHYYFLKGEALKDFKNRVGNSYSVGKQARSLLLYTKQGASRHSKMLNTERAWDMYDELEENYFNVQKLKVPQTSRELIELALKGNVEVHQRVDELDGRLKNIEENKLVSAEDKNNIDRMVRQKVGVFCRERHLNQEAKSMLFKDLGSSIKQLFNVPHRGRIKEKDFDRVVEFINHWEPSSVTKERIRQTKLDL